jgi:hypothetical protein
LTETTRLHEISVSIDIKYQGETFLLFWLPLLHVEGRKMMRSKERKNEKEEKSEREV